MKVDTGRGFASHGEATVAPAAFLTVAMAALLVAVVAGCGKKPAATPGLGAVAGTQGGSKAADKPAGPNKAKSSQTPSEKPEKPAEKPAKTGGNPDRHARDPGPGPGPALGPSAATRVELRDIGLSTPESVLHDPRADVYLVSNIAGSPLAKDDNGFILRLSPAGRVLARKWIDGGREDVRLDAPKGSALSGERLYVADIDVLRVFDRRGGRQQADIPFKRATFLNDVCAGEKGEIYVTDMGVGAGFKPSGTDAVYRVDARGTVTAIARGRELGQPNGITMLGGVLRVVTFGSGQVYSLADNGARNDIIKPRAGRLDGVIVDGRGRLVFSSWQRSAILSGGPSGPFKVRFSKLPSPADIGLDARRNRLLVPLFERDAIVLLQL